MMHGQQNVTFFNNLFWKTVPTQELSNPVGLLSFYVRKILLFLWHNNLGS